MHQRLHHPTRGRKRSAARRNGAGFLDTLKQRCLALADPNTRGDNHAQPRPNELIIILFHERL
jgi:hypothetical protein